MTEKKHLNYLIIRNINESIVFSEPYTLLLVGGIQYGAYEEVHYEK